MLPIKQSKFFFPSLSVQCTSKAILTNMGHETNTPQFVQEVVIHVLEDVTGMIPWKTKFDKNGYTSEPLRVIQEPLGASLQSMQVSSPMEVRIVTSGSIMSDPG